jgi:hypothetical protein
VDRSDGCRVRFASWPNDDATQVVPAYVALLKRLARTKMILFDCSARAIDLIHLSPCDRVDTRH